MYPVVGQIVYVVGSVGVNRSALVLAVYSQTAIQGQVFGPAGEIGVGFKNTITYDETAVRVGSWHF